MGLDALLARMEGRAPDTPDTPCNPVGVSAKPLPLQACTPDTPDTPQFGDACNDAGKSRSATEEAGQSAGTVSWGWLLHFGDRDPMPCYFTPAATHAEALALHPAAVAAEPIAQDPPATDIDADVVRDCRDCRHFRRPGLSDGHCGGRADLPRAYGDGHPLRLLPADGGANCETWEAWK